MILVGWIVMAIVAYASIWINRLVVVKGTHPFEAIAVGVVLGALARNTGLIPPRWEPYLKKFETPLLWGVVLLGAGFTAEIARAAGAKIIRHDTNYGKGIAVNAAFKKARDAKVDILVLLDGDGQHNPFEIPAILKPILDKKADVVVGSRFLASKNSLRIFLGRRLSVALDGSGFEGGVPGGAVGRGLGRVPFCRPHRCCGMGRVLWCRQGV